MNNTFVNKIAGGLESREEGLLRRLMESGAEYNCHPLSLAQERLWFLHQLAPGSSMYNIAGAVRLNGKLDKKVLEQSLREIIRRHEILRTSFLQVEDAVFQQVHAEIDFHLRGKDLFAASGATVSEAALDLALEEEVAQGFDLSQPGLFRVALFRTGERQYVLALVMHHIIADGWSVGVLVQELKEIYQAFSQGKPSPLPELDIQYVDYTAWQRDLQTAGEFDEGLAFWKNELLDAPPVLELPADKPRPAHPSFRGSTCDFAVSEQVSEKLKQLARASGATLYMTLLAAFQALLSRYTGQTDIVVGSPVSERQQLEMERLIGLFVNLAVRRTRIEKGDTFLSLLQRVRASVIHAQPFQHVPFERVVEEARQEHSISHLPLVQAVLAWQGNLFGEIRIGELTGVSKHVTTGTSKFDLTLAMEEDGEGMRGWLEYSTDLFQAETAQQIVQHYLKLLEEVAAAPSKQLSKITLLTEADSHKLARWNATATPYPREHSIAQLFEEMVERRPEAVAVAYGDEQLTYAELNRQANRIAHHLRGLGAGPESMIGICMERSPQMAAGILGIVKAGGAYVFMDPAYPQERLRFVLEDSRASLLLTLERLKDRLPNAGASIVCLDGDAAQISACSSGNPDAQIAPENLAYMTYTSGSTGKPKGVAITHRGVVRLVRDTGYAEFSEHETFLQFAPVAFDASTLEIWGALLNGGKLAIYSGAGNSVEELGKELKRHGVTTLWLTAGLFHLMVEERIDDLRGVRQLLAGGDVLRMDAVEKLRKILPECRLINGYGPTEGTTFTCCFPVSAETQIRTSVPIGPPIANTQVFILDEELRPVPVGVSGELYIGGDGLARGYWRHPELTAEKFVPDAVSGKKGARIYRTGDRARWLAGGAVEFLGRADQQVKVRGYRVEPEEIEIVLKKYPAVRHCVVLAKTDAMGEKRLVAYVTPQPGSGLNADELRAFAETSLPAYMVPSAFVAIAQLPLTANGKVDRKALPETALDPQENDWQEKSGAPPQGEVEQAVADVWAKLLDRTGIGREDNFFELGGHSLLAARMTLRLGRIFGCEVPLALVFESRTLRELAGHIDDRMKSLQQPRLEPITRISQARDLPLSSAQERLWFHHQLMPESPVYNVAGAIRLHGEVNPDALERSLAEIVRRHEILRTSFIQSEGRVLQHVHPEYEFRLERQDLRDANSGVAADEVVQQELSIEARRPFALSGPGLMRARLLQTGERECILILVLHHIVADGWSVGILIGELEELYRAFIQGVPSPLPELAVQYADYAAWQKKAINTEAMRAGLDYWKEQLAGAVALELPRDFARPVTASGAGSTVAFSFGRELTGKINDLARQNSVTANMLLLASFQALLARYTGQNDIVVGMPLANRQQEQTENLIGMLVNVAALRTRIGQGGTFSELLQQVREQVVQAQAHQSVPFEKVLEEAAEIRQSASTSLLQAVFAWQSGLPIAVQLGDIAGEAQELPTGTAKFDLTLGMQEVHGEIRAALEYSTDLFRRETMERMARHYSTLVENAVRQPRIQIKDVEFMTAMEQEQLSGWSHGPRLELAAEQCIVGAVAEQALHFPDRIALESGERKISYRELDRRANQLARHLQAMGVGLEDMVGVCRERGPEIVVAMLGILKAGAAYVSLDASSPAERLRYMLEDAGVRAVCLDGSTWEKCESAACPKMILDADWAVIGHYAPDPFRAPVSWQSLAYVIYTSGSTGRPKGVQVTHLGLRNLTEWHRRQFGLTAEDRTSQVASIGFDASVWEIWASLAAGATLCFAPEEARLSANRLRDWLVDEKIAVSFAPTPLAEQLILLKWPERTALRSLLTGGDRLRNPLNRPLPFTLFNNYGPTECAVVATSGVVPLTQTGQDAPSIGRPISNVEVYVLDSELHAVPAGLPGELYIGGAGVARGYCRRPEMTAERFIPDPFSGAAGARLYRTGDLAAYLPDGQLKFIGRVDQQVKLRGFRIELQEITTVLGEVEGARDVVVMVRGGTGDSGDGRLVAYVAGCEVDKAQLKLRAQQRLPEYMVPSAFVLLSELPLTINGKVDYRALPEPEASEAAEQEDKILGPSEEIIAGVWAGLLRSQKITSRSNFFELGGHSLLATQMILSLEELLGCSIPLRAAFEFPILRDLAGHIEAIQGATHSLTQAIPRIPRRDDLPLSSAQERLWVLDQIMPGNVVYNIPGAIRLQGALNKRALEASLKQIVHRHEALRTSFAQVDRKPVQRISEHIDFELRHTDLRSAGNEAIENAILHELKQELKAEAAYQFALSSPGLIRARLLQLGEEDHVLSLVMHHIVADGWSIGVLLRELQELYAAGCGGETPSASSLSELPIQYADYAAWQRELLAQGRLDHELAYWKQQMQGAPAVLELPTDRPRPAMQSFRGAVEEWKLSEELSAQLKQLSRSQNVTLYMTLLSGFQVLLSRYSGQKDLVVGSPVANRTRPELQPLIGFFVNVLVLRANMEGDPDIREMLKRTREACLGAYAHQTLPFDKLVEELAPERDLSRNPLFQALFILQNAPAEDLQLPGLEAAPVVIENTVSKFDLSLAIEDGAQGLKAALEFNTDLFDRATMQQMLRHYEAVLQAMAAPSLRLSEIQLLSSQEAHRLSYEWNNTEADWKVEEETVVQLIERQVRRQPQAIALEFEDSNLTYAELNHKSNQLARHLRANGVGPDSRVVLCLERSLEMVIAILGVLKAGAAYVPVDESYPEDRVKYMLADAGARLVLTQKKVKDRLQHLASDGVRWQCLDSEWPEIRNQSGENPGFAIDPENLAYVIYTSGSTGLPKGAMNTHAGLRNRLLWMQQAYGLTEADSVLQKTPFSFDVSVWEFLWPLMQGSRLVVARPGGHRDPGYLAQTIQRYEITTLHFVPSMLQAFVQQPGVEACASLKRVIASGESLPLELADKWRQKNPAELHNLYGPTEASIDVSYWPCSERKDWGVPIGLPIANIQLHVMDEYGRLAPAGVIGELYIGGIGLARGYWNRPELTAERFVPDPFSGKAGARIYRTGDRARWRMEGVLEYMGRADEQVKIRGHRIELGEIEAALRQLPEVLEAAVMVREARAGDKRLVAYVAASNLDTHNAAQLRSARNELQAALKAKLPEFMVPSSWIFFDQLPLNPNGKLDRKALLKVEPAKEESDGRAQPRTETEKAIASVWKQALGTEEISAEDNFFDVGGHSLLLAEVHKGLQETIGPEIQLMELFQYSSIRALAEHLDRKLRPAQAGAAMEQSAPREAKSCSAFAIVGMACRFPGATNIDEFWSNLKTGIESVSEFTDAELRQAGVTEEMLSSPAFVRRGAVLNDIDLFDARFFNFSAREAEMMDPQHRIFLECAWEALERAGYNADSYPGRIGVFAGSFASTYFMNLYADPEVMKSADGFALFFANGNDFLSTRVSYKLNLTGPSMTVQSGCSTSLLAIHLACKSLLNGECDMAMAGGVAVKTPQKTGYMFQEGGIFSPDGHCRSFDARAQGTIGGNGAGMVVIKRLEDAIRDRDHIHAVIKGSGVSNDGGDKPGYTAPGINGQREALLLAYQNAQVNPETVSYVEAHGTATALGDPVELTALSQAFRMKTANNQFCALGSVKTNIGHLDTAAGVAGVIKTALALEHKQIPPSLHFEQPNPKIDFLESPFYVNKALAEWSRGEHARRAGVSSFGIGGTNVHVVMEEAPEVAMGTQCRPWQLMLLSAKSVTALEAATDNLVAHFSGGHCDRLADAAHTLQVGRKAFPRRRFVVSQNIQDVTEALRTRDEKRVLTATAPGKQRGVAFLFPGQGSQFVNMGRDLYLEEPVFREHVDRCSEILNPILGIDLRQVIFPAEESRAWAEMELNETRITQPALFVIEHALARLWMSWGVTPDAMVGHSIGEYAAACLAGVFSLEDALRVVALRGQLMQACERGSMLAVMVPEPELQEFVQAGMDLAAVNGLSSCVLAGPEELTRQIEQRLIDRKIPYRRLRSSHAFHSRMMEPILDEFIAAVQRMTLRAPQMPYISSVTGDWIKDSEATDPAYWGRQLRGTVQFSKAVLKLCEGADRIVLETGPGHSGSTSIRATLPKTALPPMFTSLPDPKTGEPEQKHLLTTAGHLWLHGVTFDWNAFAATEESRRVVLPTYPFERQRYWIETSASAGHKARPDTARKAIKDWLYAPCWRETPDQPRIKEQGKGANVLLFADDLGLWRSLAEKLGENDYEVITVTAGREFARLGHGVYSLRVDEAGHYQELFSDLQGRRQLPDKIVHLWNLSANAGTDLAEETDLDMDFAFHGIANLARAVQEHKTVSPVPCLVVSNGLHEITGREYLSPGKAALLGLCSALSREDEKLLFRSIDIEIPDSGSREEKLLLTRLLGELEGPSSETVAGYRGRRRWIRRFEQLQDENGSLVPDLVQDDGVYLITGGLSHPGFEIAQWLASLCKPTLVLVDEGGFPEPEQWPSWLEMNAKDDPVAGKIRKIQQWEEAGVIVQLYQADLADEGAMRRIEYLVRESAGRVNGIIHVPAGCLGKSDDLARTCTAKIQGTIVLDKAFSSSELKFMVLCSSLNSIGGQPGSREEAAASAFMDAFARYRFFNDQCFTTSINWENWDGPEQAAGGIRPQEGLEVLRRVLALKLGPQVAVSTRDLETVLAGEPAMETADDQALERTYSRPELERPFTPPANQTEILLVRIWTEVLGVSPIGIHDNFFELGGDSLVALKMAARAQELGVGIAIEQLFHLPTIQQLAAAVTHDHPEKNDGDTDALPLLPPQREMLERGAHAARSVMVRVAEDVDVDALARVFREIAAANDFLRLRFSRSESGWQQRIAGLEECAPFIEKNLAETPEPQRQQAMDASIAELRKALHPEKEVFQAVLFRMGERTPSYLFVHALELVADSASLGLLLDQMETRYFHQLGVREYAGPTLGAGFCQWAAALGRHKAAEKLLDPPTPAALPEIPVDFSHGANNFASLDSHMISFHPEQSSRVLETLTQKFHCGPETVLLTALVQALLRWTGAGTIRFDTVVNTRMMKMGTPVAVANTIGNFSVTTASHFVLEKSLKGPAALKSIKEQWLAAGNDAMAQLAGAGKNIGSKVPSQLKFTFEGTRDFFAGSAGSFQLVREQWNDSGIAEEARRHVLEVAAGVKDGRIFLRWSYSRNLHRERSIQRLAEIYVESLNALVAACTTESVATHTPSDFPEAQLSQTDLDKLMLEIAGAKG